MRENERRHEEAINKTLADIEALRCENAEKTGHQLVRTKEERLNIDGCEMCYAPEMEELEALRRENAEKDKRTADLESRLKDWHDCAEKAWKSPCDDEQHCSCVPLLRKTLDDKEKEIAGLKSNISGTRGRGLEDGQGIEAERWGGKLGPILGFDHEEIHHKDMLAHATAAATDLKKRAPRGDRDFVIEALRRENAGLKSRMELVSVAASALTFCAETSGGTAGRDEGLCQAIEEVKTVLSIPTLGASARLRDKHYRECEEIIEHLQEPHHWPNDGGGAYRRPYVLSRAKEAIARAREGK